MRTNTIDTTNVSFHGVRSMQMNPDFYTDTIIFMVSEVLDDPELYKDILMQRIFNQDFTVSNLDFKGPYVC